MSSWFGGKSQVAHLVWERFGNVPNYVEPFFGSGAVLLQRPHDEIGIETVNDKDGFVSNFWRALQSDPAAVAKWADWPVSENDLHARHAWLKARRAELVAKLEGDPEYCDVKIAGWWVWGICSWIGSGWCSDTINGPWQVVDGQLVHLGDGGQGVNRKRVHLGGGQGVNRQLVHLGGGRGVNRQLVHLGDAGHGVNRKRVHLGNAGRGVNRKREDALAEMFAELSDRLRNVRICSGDWSRVCGPTPTIKQGLTGVFLDPPYADTAERTDDLYSVDDTAVAHGVREWALEWGEHPLMRIALCGYAGEHEMPETWTAVRWKARGGYGSQGDGAGRENAHRETIWFSPHCLGSRQATLFDTTPPLEVENQR